MFLPSRAVLSGLVVFAAVAALAAADGGYFPTAWGWSATALFVVAASTVLVADRVVLGRLELIMGGALVALVSWTALSVAWSESATRSVLEVERGFVYLGGLAALFLLAVRRSSVALPAGALAAATAVSGYALATRLFPDRFEYETVSGYQLARPLGYWNALGILATLGILLAVGFAAEATRLRDRALAAASVVVLVPTLYFTFSRGAVLALAAGVTAAVALDPRRLRLLVTGLALAPAPAILVWLASRSEGLARERALLDVAVREGHRLAVATAVLGLMAAAVPPLLSRAERRFDPGSRARNAGTVALVVFALAVAAAVLVRTGGPVDLARRSYDSFQAPLPPSGSQLQARLLSVSGNGRADYWRVAWDQSREHPWLGSGAGTYELFWHRDRPTAFDARDAHNLYLEMLAELGPLGLALLCAFLAAPFIALRAARALPLAAVAAGAYAAFLTHAALDWDWELPAITLAGLACGWALVVAIRPSEAPILPRPALRAAFAALVALGGLALAAYAGNASIAASADAAAEGDFERAERDARRAERWAPWSSDALRARGEAQLALGERARARHSFRAAVAKDPRDWNLWYGLALAGTGAERRGALARARSLSPRSRELETFDGG